MYRIKITVSVEDKQFVKKVEKAIKQCDKNKSQIEKDIKEIWEWKYDAVKLVYEEFEQVRFAKEKYKGTVTDRTAFGNLWFFKYKKFYTTKYFFKTMLLPGISKNILIDCKKVIYGYNNQIELRHTQLLFYYSLLKEYKQIKYRIEMYEANRGKAKKLASHEKRLHEMDNDINGIQKPLNALVGVDGMESIQYDFELKEETFNQMNKLAVEYSDDITFDNAITFKSEIEKMTKHLSIVKD